MEIKKIYTLRGPNYWARFPVLEVWVDLGPLYDISSAEFPGFNDRLMSWLPSLVEHHCSIGEHGGFFVRLRRGTYLAHMLEHTTLELQTLAGTPVGFGRARSTAVDGLYKVAIRYQEEQLCRECLESARQLLLAAVFDRPYDIKSEIKRLREFADRVCIGPSTMAILDAARERNIPFRRLNSTSLCQLGQGCKQRRIWTAETDQTSAIAESIAQDKEFTKKMLSAAGIPVPDGREVENAEDAWEAAQEIGCPVVVKPVDGNHGRGVFMDLNTQSAVSRAYDEAIKEGSGVLVERYAPGSEHRLLVVGNKMVAAAGGDAVTVVGDGRHRISELIELQVNSDPRRGDDESQPLGTVELDQRTLIEIEHQGYGFESVPDADVRVVVRRNDNLARDVTSRVHPSIADHAVLAARIVGLDVAGLDVVVKDISQPLEEQGGVFVEVNAGPGLLMHLKPSEGQPQPVGHAILNTMYEPGNNGRIPIVAVTGTNGKTTVTRMVATILKGAGYRVGMTCSDGVTVEDRLIESGDCAGPRSAGNVLLNPIVQAGVFEAARGGMLREGLGFDKCDVAVVTNIAEADHLGQHDIHTPEDMFKVKRTPVDVVLETGYAVLNAMDPLVARMAELSRGGVIFFSRQPDHPVILEHRAKGGKAVIARNGHIHLCEGSSETDVMPLDEVPSTHRGKIGFQIDNALAAAAAAWGLKIPSQLVRAGLHAFQGNLNDNPGRFNVFEVSDKTLVVFDGRNTAAVKSLIETLEHFPHPVRKIVFSAEEDRRDDDINNQSLQLGSAFDEVFLTEIDPDGGRPAGDVLNLLQQGLIGATRTRSVVVVPDWAAAVDAGWKSLGTGELLVVQTATIPRTVRKIQSLLGTDATDVRLGDTRGD
jgi:cyanophycin synthetase